jgi:hypothetical protein
MGINFKFLMISYRILEKLAIFESGGFGRTCLMEVKIFTDSFK